MKTNSYNYKKHSAELDYLLKQCTTIEMIDKLYPKIRELSQSIDEYVAGYEYETGC